MASHSTRNRTKAPPQVLAREDGTLLAPPCGSRLPRRLALGSIGVVLAAGAGLAFHFYPVIGLVLADQAGVQPQSSAENAPPKGDTPFRKHVSEAGIHACASVFSALGQALTLGTTYSISTQWNKPSADAHPVQAVAGMTYDTPNYTAQAAGVVFASPTSEGCEGNLVRVAPFKESCDEVVANLPQGSTLVGDLSGTPLYNLAGDAGQALLIPTDKSCVVVSVARMAE